MTPRLVLGPGLSLFVVPFHMAQRIGRSERTVQGIFHDHAARLDTLVYDPRKMDSLAPTYFSPVARETDPVTGGPSRCPLNWTAKQPSFAIRFIGYPIPEDLGLSILGN